MNDLPHDVQIALAQLKSLQCRSVSISSYGALQLGFGDATDYVIAGKYHKKRFQVELGTYGASWSYHHPRGSLHLSGGSDAQTLTSILIGASLVSIGSEGKSVVLTTNDGGTIVVDAEGKLSEDIFYAHMLDDLHLFFDPASGWTVERQESDGH